MYGDLSAGSVKYGQEYVPLVGNNDAIVTACFWDVFSRKHNQRPSRNLTTIKTILEVVKVPNVKGCFGPCQTLRPLIPN